MPEQDSATTSEGAAVGAAPPAIFPPPPPPQFVGGFDHSVQPNFALPSGNIYPNPGFETDASTWSAGTSSITRDATVAYAGSASGKMVTLGSAGAPVDAATVTFTVKPPIGANTTGTFTRHTGTGLYEFDVEPTIAGTHEARVATTNPDSAAQIEFYVAASNVA